MNTSNKDPDGCAVGNETIYCPVVFATVGVTKPGFNISTDYTST